MAVYDEALIKIPRVIHEDDGTFIVGWFLRVFLCNVPNRLSSESFFSMKQESCSKSLVHDGANSIVGNCIYKQVVYYIIHFILKD